jgi:hypothetical protein
LKASTREDVRPQIVTYQLPTRLSQTDELSCTTPPELALYVWQMCSDNASCMIGSAIPESAYVHTDQKKTKIGWIVGGQLIA